MRWSGRALQLRKQDRQLRNLVVALDHGRNRAEASHGGCVELPDFFANRFVVRIDEIVALALVAGEMELLHPVDRHAAQERRGARNRG